MPQSAAHADMQPCQFCSCHPHILYQHELDVFHPIPPTEESGTTYVPSRLTKLPSENPSVAAPHVFDLTYSSPIITSLIREQRRDHEAHAIWPTSTRAPDITCSTNRDLLFTYVYLQVLRRAHLQRPLLLMFWSAKYQAMWWTVVQYCAP